MRGNAMPNSPVKYLVFLYSIVIGLKTAWMNKL